MSTSVFSISNIRSIFKGAYSCKSRSRVNMLTLQAWLTDGTWESVTPRALVAAYRKSKQTSSPAAMAFFLLFIYFGYDLCISSMAWIRALYGGYYLLICSFKKKIHTAHYLLCIMHYNYNNSLINHQQLDLCCAATEFWVMVLFTISQGATFHSVSLH